MLFDVIKAHKVAQGSTLQDYYGEPLEMKQKWEYDFSKLENYGVLRINELTTWYGQVKNGQPYGEGMFDGGSIFEVVKYKNVET